MPIKKIAIYGTICTRDEAALEAQINELIEKVRSEETWSFDEEKDVYSDWGKSKSQMYGRVALEELIQKSKQGEYDLIVVRDVSRIARNGKLLFEIVSELKECGVDFYCVQDDILTSTRDGYFEILRFASRMNEIEHMSRMTSERVKAGLRMRKLRGGNN